MRKIISASLFFLSLTAFIAPLSLAQQRAGYYRYPAIHDNTIVFTAEGDLWTVPIEGGAARRLTTHAGQETNAAISPDGSTIAFSAEYEGPQEVYTMPLNGGLPVRRTWDGGRAVVTGWTPDGKILYTSNRFSLLPNTQLIALALDGHKEVLPLSQAADGDYDTGSKNLFFTRFAFQGSYTKRYKGGTAQNIWRFDGTSEAVPLTSDYPGTSAHPYVWNGRVIFVSDRDGSMNLWSMNTSGKDLKQLTRHRGIDVQSPSQNAGRIVYQLGPDLWLLDLKSGKSAQLQITLVSDFDNLRERWIRKPLDFLTSASIAPDGESVVFTSRGMVFVAPAKNGRLVTVAARPGVRYRDARYMPDGKSVFATSSESGEMEFWRFPANGIGQSERLTTDGKVLRWSGLASPDGNYIAHTDKDAQLWLLDTRTKENRRIAESRYGDFSGLSWSPDSRWLAYEDDGPNTFTRIQILNLATGKIEAVTSDRYNSLSPAWSTDGNWLYFISDRNLRSSVGAPWGPRQPDPHFDRTMKIYGLALKKGLRPPFEPADELRRESPAEKGKPDDAKREALKIEIDFTDITSRLFELPVPAGNYGQLSALARRLLWTDRGNGQQGLSLMAIDIAPKAELETVLTGISSFEVSRNGKKMLIRKGEDFSIFDSDAKQAALSNPKTISDAKVNLNDWSFPLRPIDEFRELFADAWRLERDYFYDKKMHGVDWVAIRKKYEPMVDRVTDRQELNDLIAQMVSELSALHTFVRGGDIRRGSDQVAMASLGALLERSQPAGGYLIRHIYRNDPDLPNDQSPLTRLGLDVNEGDVITDVDGVVALSEPDIGVLLRDKAGKQVLLRVKTGSQNPRDVIVKPISMAQEADLRYSEWEYTRRLEVDRLSGGKMGYLHLRAMGGGDIAQWVRDFYPVFNREGLIIDVRHNNGGNIDSWLLGKLLRKAWFYWQARTGEPTWNMHYAFRGHIVVLVDERTASDGEAFAEGFRRLGLGKVIGTRTWGGEIWLSQQNVLADRGIATASETGVYGPEGQWLIEGHGVDPDIVIDNLPNETFKGRDSQLEAAIKHLDSLIRKEPRPVPRPPAYPDKSLKN